MKAAVLAVCPEARFIDISHSVEPFDITAAGFVLWAGSQGFPSGTVHLAVVDPDVGSDRRALALSVGPWFYVGPDNGLFSRLVQGRRDVTAVALSRPAAASATFEGRDVFAPAAGRLARGTALAELGRPIQDLVVLPDPGKSVIWVDNFGNLVTNLVPPVGRLRVGKSIVDASARTYADASAEVPFWYVGSLGLVEIGVRRGRADQVIGAGRGTRILELPTS
jgi:S-adenosyl-L-methionine hydrolase (adenosine-forming)